MASSVARLCLWRMPVWQVATLVLFSVLTLPQLHTSFSNYQSESRDADSLTQSTHNLARGQSQPTLKSKDSDSGTLSENFLDSPSGASTERHVARADEREDELVPSVKFVDASEDARRVATQAVLQRMTAGGAAGGAEKTNTTMQYECEGGDELHASSNRGGTTWPGGLRQRPKFIAIGRVNEQLTKARLHLAEVLALARAANRTLILPGAGSSRLGLDWAAPLCTYFDLELLGRFVPWVTYGALSTALDRGVHGAQLGKKRRRLLQKLEEGKEDMGDEQQREQEQQQEGTEEVGGEGVGKVQGAGGREGEGGGVGEEDGKGRRKRKGMVNKASRRRQLAEDISHGRAGSKGVEPGGVAAQAGSGSPKAGRLKDLSLFSLFLKHKDQPCDWSALYRWHVEVDDPDRQAAEIATGGRHPLAQGAIHGRGKGACVHHCPAATSDIYGAVRGEEAETADIIVVFKSSPQECLREPAVKEALSHIQPAPHLIASAARFVSAQLRPTYVAIHWRTEKALQLIPQDRFLPCAISLVETVRAWIAAHEDNVAAQGLGTGLGGSSDSKGAGGEVAGSGDEGEGEGQVHVFLATDISPGGELRSGTLGALPEAKKAMGLGGRPDEFRQVALEAVRYLARELRPRRLEEFDSRYVQADSGVQGLLDKLVSSSANVFFFSPEKCGGKLSSYTREIMEMRSAKGGHTKFPSVAWNDPLE
eukprot:jgi/Mesen1/3924/ME000209S02929